MDINIAACELLNIPETDDALALLDISHGHIDKVSIKAGLRRQLTKLTVHPLNCEEGTQKIRAYLQDLANDLIDSVPSTKPKEQRFIKLTEFDKRVIATLVAEGGWNQKSRARLVTIASNYNVSVGQLTKILEGLAEASREGDGPLCFEKRAKHKITRGWATMQPEETALDKFISSGKDRLNLDFSAKNTVLTVKLCSFFALLVLFIMFFALALLMSEEETKVDNVLPLIVKESKIQELQDDFSPIFSEVPTFLFEEFDLICHNHADLAIELPKQLSNLAVEMNKTFLKGNTANQEWMSQWEYAIQTISFGWPYVSNELKQLISDQVINVLRRSENRPTYLKQLLEQLKLPELRSSEPFDVLVKTWKSGMLADVKCSSILSPSTRSQANSLQMQTIKTCNSLDARIECLDIILAELIEDTEFDNRLMESWEIWLIAVSSIKNNTLKNDRYLQALELLLTTDIDFLRESNSRKVLGRLVLEADQIATNQFRERILSFYRDKEITPIDMFVFGNMLYLSGNTPWFSSEFIVDPSADTSMRNEQAKLVSASWKIEEVAENESPNAIMPEFVESEQVRHWQSLFSSLSKENGLHSYLVKMRLLNEAAVYIAAGRTDEVERVLNKIDKLKLDLPIRAKQVYLQGKSGSWSDEFKDSPFEALSILSESGVNDLSEEDAITLVKAALTKRSSEIRNKATDLIITQFGDSKNVAVSLLSYADNYISRREVIKIVANLTEIVLPEINSSRWQSEARRALLQHALSTSQPEVKDFDFVSSELAGSLLDEYLILNPSVFISTPEISAVDAIGLHVDNRSQDFQDEDGNPIFVFNPTGLLQNYLLSQVKYLYHLQNDYKLSLYGEDEFIQTLQDSVEEDDTIYEQVSSIEYKIANYWDIYLSKLEVELGNEGAIR
jgi:hypothetical protein